MFTSFTHLLLVQKLINLFKSVSHVHNLSTAAFNHSEFFTKFFIGQIPNCSFVEISKHFRIGFIWLNSTVFFPCLLYTSDAADDLTRVDLGGRRIIKKKKN